jgi:hypothetical protein
MPTAWPAKTVLEVDLFVAETDSAAIGNDNGLVVEGIVDVGHSGVSASGRLIDLGRAFHLQRFMRTFVVEDFDEIIEAGLLLQEVSSGRLGGFFFSVRCMRSLAAVLLGMAGFDLFNADAEPEPPDSSATKRFSLAFSRSNSFMRLDGEDDILGVFSRAGNMQSRNRTSFLLHSYLIRCGRIAASRAVKESGDDSRW